MIKDNRFYIDEVINRPQENTSLNSILASEIKAKTKPTATAQNNSMSIMPDNQNSGAGSMSNMGNLLSYVPTQQAGGDNTLNDIAGLGQQGYSIYNSIANGAGSSMPYLGIGLNAINGITKGINDANDPNEEKFWGGVGNGIQGFFGVDDSNDSEIMQGLKGTANGAMMGTAVFPGIGTIIGGLLGLGSSFIDDI